MCILAIRCFLIREISQLWLVSDVVQRFNGLTVQRFNGWVPKASRKSIKSQRSYRRTIGWRFYTAPGPQSRGLANCWPCWPAFWACISLNKEVLNRSVETSKCRRTFVKSMVDIEKHTSWSLKYWLKSDHRNVKNSARTGGRNTNNFYIYIYIHIIVIYN